MGRADGSCAKNRRPDGVAFSFQVILNKIEPPKAELACNLFAKQSLRAADLDEAEEGWPEMSLVGEASAFSGVGEWLTGA